MVSKSEIIRSRIWISIAAYQYEHNIPSIMDDATYDETAVFVHKYRDRKTGKPLLDKFFAEEFDPETGMWIHKHPELHIIEDRATKWLK